MPDTDAAGDLTAAQFRQGKVHKVFGERSQRPSFRRLPGLTLLGGDRPAGGCAIENAP